MARWFEVDQEDVQHAKRKILASAGAGLQAGQAADFALKAGEWHSIVANLAHPGWSQTLQGEGLDPSHPTLWLAEGLLYYLEDWSVKAMLSEAAQVQPRLMACTWLASM